MAFEDFAADYTEVDADGDLTRTTTNIDMSTMKGNADSHITKDFGASHFSGDYTHLFKINSSGNFQSNAWVCGLGTVAGHIQDCIDASGFHLGVELYTSGSGPAFYLNEVDGTGHNVGDNIQLSNSTDYWFTLERDEAGGGSYGVMNLSIFSDSGRTTEVTGSPIAYTITVQKTDFQFAWGCTAKGSGNDKSAKCDIDDWDLQEAAGGFVPYPYPTTYYDGGMAVLTGGLQ